MIAAVLALTMGLQTPDPELDAAKQFLTDFASIIYSDPAAADAMLAPDFQACDTDYCMGRRSVKVWPFSKLGCRFVRSAGASWSDSKRVLVPTKWTCAKYGPGEVTALIWVKDRKISAVNMYGSWS